MGLIGLFSWLGEDLDKLKVLKSITKDSEQLAIIDEIINDIESKSNENQNQNSH